MDASAVGAIALEHLEKIEKIRTKCKNIKGDLTGKIRDLTNSLKELVAILVEKADGKGDPTFLRMRANELAARNKELEKENKALKTQRFKTTGNNNYDNNRKTSDLNEPRECNTKKRTETASENDAGNEIEVLIARQIETLIDARERFRSDRLKKKTEDSSQKRISRARITSTRGNRAQSPLRVPDKIIIEDTTQYKTENEWTEVVAKKNARAAKKVNRDTENSDKKLPNNRKDLTMRKRPPRSDAVAIKGRGESFSYADALKKARGKINLAEIGIDRPRIRKAANGGLLIEVPGVDGTNKADILADRLRETLDSEVVITRPVKKGDIRLTGVDDSTTSEEIAWIMAENGGCSPDVVKIGPIYNMRNGLRLTTVSCPLASAIKIASIGKIRLGWTMVKVELLRERPIQCFRCWEFGHIGARCESQTERYGACFNCGQAGHKVNECHENACCPVCKEHEMD